MNKIIIPEIKEVMEAVHYRPAISIIMPFEPKMSSKAKLGLSLARAVHKVEEELVENYSKDMYALMSHKLRDIIKKLNFNTHKKSIAIYVSPIYEKILYLDLHVEEKTIVDESFEIRDLIYCKKQLHKYLVLHLSGKAISMYIGNSETFIRIVSNIPKPVYIYNGEDKERVANFSDIRKHKEIAIDKFMHYADNSLGIILNSYNLPLFVIGNEKILGSFKKITRHSEAVIEYIQGNYEDSSLPELKNILNSYVSDWKKVIQKDVLNQLEKAAGKKKLAFGMKNVWHEAMKHNGKLLIIEKNFMYAAERGSSDEIIYKAIEPYNKFSYIKDAVDDVIEKVLATGGDVEFVDEDLLKTYHHIALIQYY